MRLYELAPLSSVVYRKQNRCGSCPGRPTQNAHVESFHVRLRYECVNISWFGTSGCAQEIGAWCADYDGQRPHSALGYLTSQEFVAKLASPSEALRIARPDLPQAYPGGFAVAVAPAPPIPRASRAKKSLEES